LTVAEGQAEVVRPVRLAHRRDPCGVHTPASRIFLINSFGTGSGFSRRIGLGRVFTCLHAQLSRGRGSPR
jgi:hypothetical protein